MTSTPILALLAAPATVIFLSACSAPPTATHDGHTDHGASETTEITGTPAGFDADDVTFATTMIPHHQQAVALAGLVPDRTTNAELIALAEQVSAAQQPEIDTMKAFLVQWEENPQDDTGHAEDSGRPDMAGMVDEATMAKLQTANGAEFDTLWLQSMISHHQGAIEMAEAEVANGQNVDAKQLAQNIVTAQQAEIDRMQAMLGGNR